MFKNQGKSWIPSNRQQNRKLGGEYESIRQYTEPEPDSLFRALVGNSEDNVLDRNRCRRGLGFGATTLTATVK
jgi:hypothetical protein